MTHCPVLGLTPKSAISVGRATPRSISLRKTMNVETIRTPMTRATPGGSRSPERVVGAAAATPDAGGVVMYALAIS
ncbi:hypothetical protein GCM10023220_13620 [Streptomyces ziwulingensis]|uniref:Uncharacterized protein n=1 Tax=Streptomyces ziwulingensis TaxID=1045501 RepID=A0ABP9B5D1_9ACTN